ncbi:type I 3-dehydroquinase-domain-containing protein [Tricharina praecox]|uniref:type I 3-dehydroquinase-domain-containing protein n=1 Tax=Tricharina praecox TaxID=43433 RepID=UPI00221EC867|nr:type I 3-dehydroquinase-domain-containing protein [Tricharina praecox]KAI5858677.1 type I 3-dehydroquinase-domain-containing protein [Tricharina praecox]
MKRKAADVHDFEIGPSPARPSPPHWQAADFPHGPCPRTDAFSPNASIALVGLRGVGKSTIGVILSSMLRRRLIDGDVYFVGSTGMSIAQYVNIHGWPGFRAKEAELMDEILRENGTDTVIVCPSGCVETASTRSRLQEWMNHRPVVHIIRNEDEIRDYLQPQSPASSPSQRPNPPGNTLRRLVARREPMYSSCSNLVFYNMWDKQQHPTVSSGRYSPSAPTLKNVEQDFLRLLNFVFRREMAPVWDWHGPHPSSAPVATAVEERSYTYALRMPPNPSFGTIVRAPVMLEELGETVDAFDLRIDFLLHPTISPAVDRRSFSTLCFIAEQFACIRRRTSVPVVYHVKTEHQGGCFPAHPGNINQEKAYFHLLYHGIRLGAEYVIVELNYNAQMISDLVARKGATKIIGAHFERQGTNFDWDSPERLQLYERGARLGCDIVKLGQKANSMQDNFAAIAFTHAVEKRRSAGDRILPGLMAFNTGSLGKLSRSLNKTLSPVTHTLLLQRQQLAGVTGDEDKIDGKPEDEEDMTPQEAISAIHACGILPRLNFCILGSAIRHSLSPAMHNAAYKVYGMPHSYRICETPTINQLLTVVQDPAFGGASVTLPFKLEIIPLIHTLSDHARAIGAVNTIIPIRPTDNKTPVALHGDNTDWIGIRTCVLRYLTPVNAITSSTTSLVIGAGGMARAAIYALQKIGVENIFLCNRTASRAMEIAEYFNSKRVGDRTPERASPSSPSIVRYLSYSEVSWPTGYRLPTIVVCCIPAHSIQGAPPANFTLPNKWLESPTGGVCVELAYKPRVTPLLHQIRTLAQKGWIGVDGLEVLPEQGFAQFELFLGRKAPRRVMRDAVEQAYVQERK